MVLRAVEAPARPPPALRSLTPSLALWLKSLLFFPERQQPLRSRASDHAGNSDRDLPQRSRRNAAQRHRADPDLSPEIQIAPSIRALGLEFIDRSNGILAHGAELNHIGGLHDLLERCLHRFGLPAGELA